MIRFELSSRSHEILGQMPPLPSELEAKPFEEFSKFGYAVYIDKSGNAFTRPVAFLIDRRSADGTKSLLTTDVMTVVVPFSDCWQAQEVFVMAPRTTSGVEQLVPVGSATADEVTTFLRSRAAAIGKQGGRIRSNDWLYDIAYVLNAVIDDTSQRIPLDSEECRYARCYCYWCKVVLGVEICQDPQPCPCC
ncbi:MAG: hypothetical protein M3041_09385 [Acidobacteriota bacterium]|nr:hypothetical protein [Acidobacteriota bacterium]